MAAMKYSNLIVLVVVVKTTFCQEVSFRVNPNHLNKRLQGHILFEIKGKGLHQCVNECKFLGACESFNYITGNRVCELNDVSSDRASPGELVEQPLTIFADITEFPSTMVGGCANHKCGYYKRCYPVGRSYICADIDCGSPKPISNGVLKLNSLSTKFGTTASVTCNPGYKATTLSAVCKASGKWQKVKCRQEGVIVGSRVRLVGTDLIGTVSAVHPDGSVDVKWTDGGGGRYTVGVKLFDVTLI